MSLTPLSGCHRGLIAAISGLYVGFYANLESGASIVLIETLFFIVPLLFGPRSGLLSGRLARRRDPEPAV